MLPQSRKTFWKLVISPFEYTSPTGCFLLEGTASSILTVLLAIKVLNWIKICFSNFWPICSILPNGPAVHSFFPIAALPVFVDSHHITLNSLQVSYLQLTQSFLQDYFQLLIGWLMLLVKHDSWTWLQGPKLVLNICRLQCNHDALTCLYAVTKVT